VDQIKKSIKCNLIIGHSKAGTFYYLEKNGEEIAEVSPCEGRDLSVLEEGNDEERES